MTAFIEELSFVSLTAVTYDFASNDRNDVGTWLPSIARRGSQRARMQQHGTHPRRTAYEGLVIDHEGRLIGDTQQEAVEERDAMVAALLGDLTVVSDETSIGVLTVKYLGWAESASASVSLDGGPQTGFRPDDIRILAYQLQWRCDLPYFIGDTSGDPVFL